MAMPLPTQAIMPSTLMALVNLVNLVNHVTTQRDIAITDHQSPFCRFTSVRARKGITWRLHI